MARHVRKGDLVYVRTGDDRGLTGTVLRVNVDKGTVLVEGINVHRKNVKRDQRNPQGGLVEIEMPIHMSNVSPVADGRPTRVRFPINKDGAKVRVAVTNGEQLGVEIKKARK